ncbi:flippase [Halorubraceae archaeon YAN]|nr:flippase [Halorubraceae archaeon YAN]
MSLTTSLLSRFKAQFASQIISAIASAVLVIGLARLLDPNAYGLLFLATSIFGTLELFARLGFAKSAARYIAEYKEKSPDQVPHIIRNSFAFISITTLCVATALVVGNRYIAEFVGEPELAPFLVLGFLYLGFGTFGAYIQKVLQGFEAIELAALLNVLERLSQLFLVLGFVVLGYGAIGALWGYILSYMLAAALGLGIIYKRVYSEGEIAPSIEPGLRRRMAEYSIPLTATSGANVLDKRVDTILVGVLLNPAAVSYYVISKQVIDFIEAPISALGFTLSPTFGAQKADGNIGQASRIYETALTHSLLLYVPAAAGIILIADPLVNLVFGAGYAGAVPVLQILGFYVILQTITKITSNALDFLGRARARAIVKGVTSVLNVVFNIILIPLFGVVGAAIATIITYSMYTFANVYIISQEFELHFKLVLRNVLLITIITSTMSVIVFALLNYIRGWITLFIVVGIGVFVWALQAIFIGLLDVEKIRSMLI